MSDRLRMVRKVQVARAADFDDQLWPINCTILILAGFVAGIVIAQSSFSEPRLLYNGWTHLASVGLMVGLLFLGVWWLQGKMLRRLQLCILLSLLAHVWLVYDLHRHYLVFETQPDEIAQQVTDPYAPAVVPEFHLQMPQPRPQPQERESFEEPIPTEIPLESEPAPLEPQPAKQEPLALEKPPAEAEPLARQEPSPLELRRAELSAPRRADLAAGGQISRQPWKDHPLPGPPVPAPELMAAAPRPRAAPNQQLTAMGRQAAEPPPFERRTFREPISTEPHEVVRMARQAAESEPLPDVPTTPNPTRQLAMAAEVPRTEATVPEPEEVVAQAEPAEPQPTPAPSPRRLSEAPEAPQWAARPVPRPTTVPQALLAAAPRTPQRPDAELASQPEERPSRSARLPALPTIAARAEAPAAAASPTPAVEPPVVVAEVPRQQNQPASGSAAEQTPDLGVSSTATRALPRRVMRADDQPLINPRPAAPRQTRIALALPEQPVGAEQETGSMESATASPGPLQPATVGLAKAASGPPEAAAGLTSAGRSVAPMTHLAQLPDTPARRARPTSDEAGAELGPSRPSNLRRAQPGGAPLPSTAIASEAEATRPARAGSPLPSRLEAPSGAAVVARAGAQAPSAPRDAAAGPAEMAVGSQQLASRLGQPRAGGLGEPASLATADEPRVARADRGLSLSLAPAAERAAMAGAATGGEAAAGLPLPAPSAQAAASGRQGRPVLPVERPALGSGAEGASGTAARVPVAQLARVTRHESDNPTGLSGGGAKQPAPARAAVGPGLVAQAEGAEPAGVTGTGRGAKPGSPLEAGPLAGLDRQVAGLPGRSFALPAAGSLAATGGAPQAPLPEALARRDTAGQRGAGGIDLAPGRSAGLARSRTGAELPAMAEPVESASPGGSGGIAQSPGALASSLDVGPVASVRRAAAGGPEGDRPVPAGLSALGTGTAGRATLAGLVPAGRDEPPALAAGSAPQALGRTAGGPALDSLVQGAAEVPGGQAAQLGGPAQPEGGALGGLAESAAAQVGRAGGAGLAELGPVRLGAPAARGTAGAASVRLLPSGRDDVALLAQGGAQPGTLPKMTRAPSAALPGEATEMAAEGPTPGQPASAGEGILQAATTAPTRQWAGLPGELNQRVSIDLADVAGPTATTPGTVAGPRRLPEGMDDQPALAAERGGAVLGKTNRPGLPRGIAETAEPQPSEGIPAEQVAVFSEPTDALELGAQGRREGGLPVQVAALSGPGGLSFEPSPEVGIPNRKARPESDVVHMISRRFVVPRSGGDLSIDGAVREPTEPYRQRAPGRRGETALAFGGGEDTEMAVEAGLDFFARFQFPDGHWSLDQVPPGVEVPKAQLGQMRSDTAATGLALLTYLGAGYTHRSDKHRNTVRRGLDWLVRTQNPETGELFAMADSSEPTAVTRFYGHGIAAIALCEAYGMTQDPELREPARKAVQYILNTQHATLGGWRYYTDRRTGRSTETDTSVTGWMLMALKSAQMAGLDVPQEAFDKIDHWLELAHAPDAEGRYVYNPYALDTPEQRHGRLPSRAMTAEAMLMAVYLGRGPDDPRLRQGADYLKANLPEVGTAERSLRDCYYWYYATQAMFQMQGDHWQAWNERMRPLLKASQVERGPLAGSWDPLTPVEDRWGKSGGRLYVTSLHLLMLEVYYRHLPLFQELTR